MCFPRYEGLSTAHVATNIVIMRRLPERSHVNPVNQVDEPPQRS